MNVGKLEARMLCRLLQRFKVVKVTSRVMRTLHCLAVRDSPGLSQPVSAAGGCPQSCHVPPHTHWFLLVFTFSKWNESSALKSQQEM